MAHCADFTQIRSHSVFVDYPSQYRIISWTAIHTVYAKQIARFRFHTCTQNMVGFACVEGVGNLCLIIFADAIPFNETVKIKRRQE